MTPPVQQLIWLTVSYSVSKNKLLTEYLIPSQWCRLIEWVNAKNLIFRTPEPLSTSFLRDSWSVANYKQCWGEGLTQTIWNMREKGIWNQQDITVLKTLYHRQHSQNQAFHVHHWPWIPIGQNIPRYWYHLEYPGIQRQHAKTTDFYQGLPQVLILHIFLYPGTDPSMQWGNFFNELSWHQAIPSYQGFCAPSRATWHISCIRLGRPP